MLLKEMMPVWFAQMGLMAWPLLICSIIAIAIGVERLFFLIKIKVQEKKTYQRLYEVLLTHQHEPKTLRDELVANKLNELQSAYFSGVNLLRVIGNISPMLGLTGTILGIISAFKVIAAHTGPVTPNIIAAGLWEAMLTTAVGLLIAVPTLLMAYLFKHIAQQQLDDYCRRLNNESTSFEINKRLETNDCVIPKIKNIAA